MQTQRLQTLVSPAHVEQLLDSYVTLSRAVPPTAVKQRDWASLPADIRHVAARAFADGCACLAWSDGDATWVFSASLALERSREFGRPVLEVQSYDTIRQSRTCVAASRLPDGAWRDCVDL
ncbi:MAG: hypothetical protein NDI84_12545 [Steroidobacteraceae bacterium]|nr:hypothetical protein [Steroidobacteraceae bacterium]